jgi:hypothetical protein
MTFHSLIFQDGGPHKRRHDKLHDGLQASEEEPLNQVTRLASRNLMMD